MHKTVLMLTVILFVSLRDIFPAKLCNLINNSGQTIMVEVYSTYMEVTPNKGFEPAYCNEIPAQDSGKIQQLNVIVMPTDTLSINNTKIPIEYDELVFDVEVQNTDINIIPISTK